MCVEFVFLSEKTGIQNFKNTLCFNHFSWTKVEILYGDPSYSV